MVTLPLADLAGLLADAGAATDFAVFAQFGAVGLIAALGIVFAKGAHQREKDRSDRLEAENQRLNALLLDRVIPALTSATRAAEESTELLASMQRERSLDQYLRRQRPSTGDDVQ